MIDEKFPPMLYWKDQFSTFSYFNLVVNRSAWLYATLYSKKQFVISIGIISDEKARKLLSYPSLVTLWP